MAEAQFSAVVGYVHAAASNQAQRSIARSKRSCTHVDHARAAAASIFLTYKAEVWTGVCVYFYQRRQP